MGSAKALKSYVSNIDDKFMEGFCCRFPLDGINFSNALLLYIVDAAFEATAAQNMTPLASREMIDARMRTQDDLVLKLPPDDLRFQSRKAIFRRDL